MTPEQMKATIDAQANEIARLREALKDADVRCDALRDLEYISGAYGGWNCAQSNDEKGMEAILRRRRGPALKVLKELKAKRAALQEPKV